MYSSSGCFGTPSILLYRLPRGCKLRVFYPVQRILDRLKPAAVLSDHFGSLLTSAGGCRRQSTLTGFSSLGGVLHGTRVVRAGSGLFRVLSLLLFPGFLLRGLFQLGFDFRMHYTAHSVPLKLPTPRNHLDVFVFYEFYRVSTVDP